MRLHYDPINRIGQMGCASTQASVNPFSLDEDRLEDSVAARSTCMFQGWLAAGTEATATAAYLPCAACQPLAVLWYVPEEVLRYLNLMGAV